MLFAVNEQCPFSFYCYRKVPMDVCCLPNCPFTLWAYNTEICRCDYRPGVFKLLLEDYVTFMNYEEYDVIEANIKFHRVYSQIPDTDVLLQENHDL